MVARDLTDSDGTAAAGQAGSSPASAAGRAAAGCWQCGGSGKAQQAMPLDSEGKACKLRLLSCAAPHMRAFHLAWMSHFAAIFATFAAAPLLPVIRDNLNLDKSQLSAAGIAAVGGTVFSRVVMGGICDRWGPRYGLASSQLLTASASFGMALVESSAGYLAARLFIGFSIASFVACQFWCSVMFNAKIVGTANAVAAGWGASAGGVVQLIMPLLLEGFKWVQPDFIAWRTCYLCVGWLQITIGILVLLFGQDLPHGNYASLRRQGHMNRGNSAREYLAAAKNYRTWVLAITYGVCFGAELTMNNVLSQYIHDTFETGLAKAGAVASIFGLVNIVSRPAGGLLSDRAALRFGMRGRLWVLFLLQVTGSAFCCGISQMGGSLGGTVAMVLCMALAMTAASGATFGCVVFISRRGCGAAIGFVGAGGNVGSAVLQALFFTGNNVNWSQGFLRMGLMSLGLTMLLLLVHFPMWGGMLPCGAFACGQQGVTEEEYYSRDYTAKERQLGMHSAVLNFAAESRTQRGTAGKRVAEAAADPAARPGHDMCSLQTQTCSAGQPRRGGSCAEALDSPAEAALPAGDESA